MIVRKQIKSVLVLIIAIMTLFKTFSNAELIVYEGFQYDAVNDSLHGQPDDPGVTDTDATGLTGTWVDSTGATGNMFLKSGNLFFGDLPSNGNHIGFESNLNNDIFNRTLTVEAQAGISSAGEIWFSILFEKLQNNFSAGEGGFVLANKVLGNTRIFENNGSDGLAGFGFGPTTAGDDLKPYAWDGSTQIAGDAAISVPPANGTTNTSGSNFGDVRLIVGQISFDTGAGGTDQYTLYDYTLNGSSVIGGTLNQIATTLEVNLNQGDIKLVNLTRQVNLNYDELRIGTSLDDVLGYSPVDAGDDKITWSGQGVTLAPSFEEGYTPNSFLWITEAPAGYIVEWDPNAMVEAPIITITKDVPTGGDGKAEVKVKLTADDGTGPESDTLTMDVYDDACLAAKGSGVAELDATDTNQDCITNLEDYFEIATEWLIDYTITTPMPKP